MREQLIQYVELLFAAAHNSTEIKQEILQNTLDRYDDLIAQGKPAEAAYRLAISGIGDINEILSGESQYQAAPSYRGEVRSAVRQEADTILKRIFRAVAAALYILCPTPLFVLSEMGMDTIGLCGTLAIVAVATVLMLLGKKPGGRKEEPEQTDRYLSPKDELRKSIGNVIWAIGLALYFIVSFLTGAWYITWVIFPIIGSVRGLVNACIDLKEACNYED